jgi:PAS domain S-box-containing protein
MLNELPISNSKILLVDDEPTNIELMAAELGRAGFAEVFGETNSRDAAATCRNIDADLVILDLSMPGKSGFEVLEEIQREYSPDSFIPVLVYTGQNDLESRRRAYELGATDFVTRDLGDSFEVVLRARNLLGIRYLQNRLEQQNDLLEQTVRERTEELNGANAALHLENIEKAQVERELRHTEERLRFLLQASPASVRAFKPSPPYASIFVSNSVADQTGFASDEFLESASLWKDRVHPDDASRVWSKLQRIDSEDAQIEEYRFVKASGDVVWLHEERKVIRSQDGKPLEVIAALVDITERKVAEETLSQQAMALATANARLEEFDASDCHPRIRKSASRRGSRSDQRGAGRVPGIGHPQLRPLGRPARQPAGHSQDRSRKTTDSPSQGESWHPNRGVLCGLPAQVLQRRPELCLGVGF